MAAPAGAAASIIGAARAAASSLIFITSTPFGSRASGFARCIQNVRDATSQNGDLRPKVIATLVNYSSIRPKLACEGNIIRAIRDISEGFYSQACWRYS
jgi:hypothetical protein